MGVIVDQNPDVNSIDNWAMVKDGVVSNLITARLDFIQNISQSYDYAVDLTINGQSPVIGWGYNHVANTFAPIVVIPPLSVAKMRNLTAFNVALQQYSDSYFTHQTQFRFFVMWSTAGLKLNRKAYIDPLWDWVESIQSYAASYTASVMAEADAATALNKQWDLSQISSPPAITLLAAIQINN